MSIILTIAIGLLFTATALVLVRILLGPTNLDRALSLDVLLVIITGIIATQILRTDDVSALPIMVVFSLTGYVGSVSVARFMARREDDS